MFGKSAAYGGPVRSQAIIAALVCCFHSCEISVLGLFVSRSYFCLRCRWKTPYYCVALWKTCLKLGLIRLNFADHCADQLW
jgi:hypothetical protein